MRSEFVTVSRNFEYSPYDFLVAVNTIVRDRFGEDAIQGIRRHWYSKRKPLTYQPVKVAFEKEAQVVAGSFEIEGFPGWFTLDPEHVVMHAYVTKELRPKAEHLLLAVQKHLEQRSIYRGKAIRTDMEFMDLSAPELDTPTFNDELLRDLQADVWTLIEQPEQCRKANIRLQRKVLFSGPYGSGKTYSALLTARKAVAHGWTFIYLPPSQSATSSIAWVLEFARKYQPAVVFIEDFDREQREKSPYAMGFLMNAIDGAMSKTGQLMVVMTTNFPEKLAGGVQRPGRIDKIIDFSRFTATDVERLLRTIIPATLLGPDIDWNAVGAACKGYTPVFVAEVGNSAKLVAISESRGALPRVTQRMLLESAAALSRQHEACSKDTLGFHVDQK